MTQPYVYRLIDRLNGKRYIGVRRAKGCSPCDIGKSYFTSSKFVRPIFSKDPSRFEVQIIAQGDAAFVVALERSLIDIYGAVNSDDFYNRTNNRAVHLDDALRGAVAGGKSSRDNRVGIHAHTKEQKKSNGRLGGALRGKELRSRQIATFDSCSSGGKAGGATNARSGLLARLNAERWVCSCCGKVSSAGGLGLHQKLSGHNGKELLA